MRICLMIEGQENVTWDQWRALARTTEEHGFDALLRSDHYLSLSGRDIEGTLDAWSTINALAALTERIHLGTLVSPATFRHPSVLAKSVLTADHVSGGRVELGMGAGWNEGEHRAYGFPFPSNAERFDMLVEQIEIVHRLWSREEETVSFDGRYYHLEDCRSLPKAVQEPHPRLMLGGDGGPRAARLAARWADEYNTTFASVEEVAAIRGRLDQACEAAGRDPATLPMSMMTGFVIGATDDEARQRATDVLATRRRPPEGDANADPVAALGEAYVAGTPDRVLARLADLAAVGVTRIMLQHLRHTDLDSLALTGAEVIPQAAAF